MRRRTLVSLIVGAAATWPLPLGAQQPAMPVVGVLNSASAGPQAETLKAFRRGLMETGYVEGENVTIEYREAANDYSRLPGLADELVRRNVKVIVAAGGPVSVLAAKKATADIPIVFTTISDPVKSGLVASLNRPGGNVTGTAGLTSELDPKRLELLHQIKPTGTIGVLVNPNRPNVDVQMGAVAEAAKSLNREVFFAKAGLEPDLDTAFETLGQKGIGALLVTADPLFNSRRAYVVERVARLKIPAIYQWREFAAVGGLMSYGPSITAAYHQTGIYVGRLLKGAKIEDLPVMQPTKFELVINLKTAKALGLAVPDSLRAIATETID